MFVLILTNFIYFLKISPDQIINAYGSLRSEDSCLQARTPVQFRANA
jgi:hypothetical protein